MYVCIKHSLLTHGINYFVLHRSVIRARTGALPMLRIPRFFCQDVRSIPRLETEVLNTPKSVSQMELQLWELKFRRTQSMGNNRSFGLCLLRACFVFDAQMTHVLYSRHGGPFLSTLFYF